MKFILNFKYADRSRDQPMREEQKFLHDIASPISTIQLSIENAIVILNDKNPEEIETCLEILNGCLAQINKSVKMIQERRSKINKEPEA